MYLQREFKIKFLKLIRCLNDFNYQKIIINQRVK